MLMLQSSRSKQKYNLYDSFVAASDSPSMLYVILFFSAETVAEQPVLKTSLLCMSYCRFYDCHRHFATSVSFQWQFSRSCYEINVTETWMINFDIHNQSFCGNFNRAVDCGSLGC